MEYLLHVPSRPKVDNGRGFVFLRVFFHYEICSTENNTKTVTNPPPPQKKTEKEQTLIFPTQVNSKLIKLNKYRKARLAMRPRLIGSIITLLRPY